MRGAALLALGLVGCAGEQGPRAKNLVLITLDTTRRDALTCMGGPPGVTPNLDRLADEAVVYLDARTVAPLTLPAHTSMMTGLYPPRHTVRDNSLTPVPQAASTLAERAHEAGFSTGAVVAAAVLSSLYALDQGFDHYDEPPRQGPGFAPRPADEVTERAVEWLEGRAAGERFFLWAHYFDPHKPYEPEARFLEQAGGDAYLGCVAQMDAGLGGLLDALRERADWEDTLVVVVSDHGEGLGEHGEQTHSAFVFDTTIRVPLLMRLPGGEAAGQRSGGMVSVADVFPTAIDLLGLGAAGDVDGVSLGDEPASDRGVYFESYYGLIYHQWSPLAGWADGDGKYVHSTAPELYRTDVDPGETANLVGERDVSSYVEALGRICARTALAPEDRALDRDMIVALEKLGYAGAGGLRDLPDALELEADLPSPHGRADELGAIVMAWNLGARDRFADAARVLEGVVRVNPRNHGAWSRLGRMRLRLGDHAAAAEALERFVELGPPWPEDYLNLGLCYRILRRDEEAITWLDRGLALAPDNAEALQVLFELYQEAGRDAEAAQVYARLEALR